MSYPYEPDYVVAPAETLREWMREAGGISDGTLAVMCAGNDFKDTALLFIRDVLERRPLGEAHARILAHGTRIPVTFWLALEHNYREGLAAGKWDGT